jgi:cytochrome P450
MLSSFISHGLNEHDLVAESIIQILAGSGTTATALRSILLYTITNSLAYRALQAEINTVVKDGHVNENEVITDSVAKDLPYLQAVIKEGLRVLPLAGGLLSKLSPPEGDTFTLASGEEVHIPGGVNVGWSTWGFLRDETTFGADANVFRPERWLQAEAQKLATMDKVLELNFRYGKYKCLGRNVAWIELNKVVFELFRKFEMVIVNPAKPWRGEHIGLWLQNEMWVRVTERLVIG